MKSIAFIALLVSTNAFASTQFNCTTSSPESYYVKQTMNLSFESTSVFAQLRDAESQEWFDGSLGRLSTKKDDGTLVYRDFDSTGMFGELSEGAADKGIYLYVSPEVGAGMPGQVSLVARGTEAGFGKATYTCSVQ